MHQMNPICLRYKAQQIGIRIKALREPFVYDRKALLILPI